MIQVDGFSNRLVLPESEEIDFLYFLGANIPKCHGVDTSYEGQFCEDDVVIDRNDGQEIARRRFGRMHHSECTGLRLYTGRKRCHKCYLTQKLLRERKKRLSKVYAVFKLPKYFKGIPNNLRNIIIMGYRDCGFSNTLGFS